MPARRPRPVADVPAVDPVALTKGWLIALVLEGPLARAAELPAAELARGGPPLCTALLAALGTDAELDRLRALAAGAARLIGAEHPAAVVAGVNALRAVTWRALRDELRAPEADVVADLAERLAYLCGLVCTAALADVTAAPESRSAAGPPPGVRVVGAAPPGPAAPAAPPTADPLRTLADELTGPAAIPASPPDTPTVRRRERSGWDGHADAAPPWLAAIVRRLERHAEDCRPFGVLLAEVDDLDRLLAAGVGPDVAAALEAAERALTAELAPADLVVRERLGRWWLTTPGRDRPGARELAERVAAAVATARVHGVPLAASVGVAVCPDDGEDLEALAGRADEGMFAARAAGVPVA